MRTTKSFNPVDYCFAWTSDGWYTWDSKAARAKALAERNAEAARLAKAGYTVRKYTVPSQRITLGGIGSGHPEVDFVVTVYFLTATKD